jgi:formylglycine-generating enzyme required for sulfatase activity
MDKKKLWVMLILVAAGCAKGRAVPQVTQLVYFEAEVDLSFRFGTETACTAGKETNTCDEGEKHIAYPTVEITLDAFAIDEHEVTNLQYVHCVANGECIEPKYGNAVSITKYYDKKGNKYDNYPVINVTQNQAQQFCSFVGKRLPTEFEWELAATSERNLNVQDEDTTNNVIYPWDSKLVGECAGKEVAISKCNANFGSPQAVMSMNDDNIYNGSDHIYDMAGNVMEWVSDAWDEDVTCWSSETDVPECSGNNNSCLNECTSTSNSGYLCTPYDPLEEPYDWTDINRETGGDFTYRGASYLTKNLCDARITYRRAPKFVDGQGPSNLDLGFRCACTASECPN